MAVLTLSVDDRLLRVKLKGMNARVRNLRPFYKSVGNYMVGRTQDRIKDERSPDGTPFAPLSKSWIRRKEKRNQILKRLQMEGTLVSTISAQIRPDGVAIGSNQKYASIHQFGGKAGQGRRSVIPARPYLGVNSDDVDEITGLLEDQLVL